jgi:hypothetical protein
MPTDTLVLIEMSDPGPSVADIVAKFPEGASVGHLIARVHIEGLATAIRHNALPTVCTLCLPLQLKKLEATHAHRDLHKM